MLDAADRRLLARVGVLALGVTLVLVWLAGSVGLAWRVLWFLGGG